jgi:hypothetical protein
MYSPFETIRVGIGDWKGSVSAGATLASCSSLNHESSSRDPEILFGICLLLCPIGAPRWVHVRPFRAAAAKAVAEFGAPVDPANVGVNARDVGRADSVIDASIATGSRGLNLAYENDLKLVP